MLIDPPPLEPNRLMALAIPRRDVAYVERDAMLYALAVGCGSSPWEPDLPFVYEQSQLSGQGLRVVPSMATMLAFDDSWLEPGGIDLSRVVHGALDLTFHHPLAPAGVVEVASRIIGLSDKGAGRGGVVLQETILTQNGVAACASLSTLFARGGGGFGGSVGEQAAAHAVPDRAADRVLAVPTAANQALLFRLLGDRNPLHVDPAVAERAGVGKPILHGACTFGIACVTLLRVFCGMEPGRLTRLAARFAGPLYPGETLAFAFWEEADGIAFRAVAREREAIVLDNGWAVLAR
ncbi:MAG TPA: MaoC/PaaZ C-terminal domain-containing protein [Stellaceae bacterium]|nr:MaoC/PaaZ C-terminal domain-containing protein [Stellaceae bacterium]